MARRPKASITIAKQILVLRRKVFGRRANARRGLNPKNVAQLLREGLDKRAKAIAEGADVGVLPPDDPIRKRAEADWERLLMHGFAGQGEWPRIPRGKAGREAVKKFGTTTSRKMNKKQQALELRGQGLREIEIAERIGRTERTVRRYLTGR